MLHLGVETQEVPRSGFSCGFSIVMFLFLSSLKHVPLKVSNKRMFRVPLVVVNLVSNLFSTVMFSCMQTGLTVPLLL